MNNKRFGILNKSEELCAAMNEDEIEYILYVFRGHLYRLTWINGDAIITAADDSDRAYYERSARA